MSDDGKPGKRPTLGEQLEAGHRRFAERVRQHELVNAMRSLEAKQAEVLALATRGVAEKVRLSRAGDRGGRKRAADDKQVAAAVAKYMKANPHWGLTGAQQQVAEDLGVSVRTVERARVRSGK